MLGEILLILGVFEILLGIAFYLSKHKGFLYKISESYIAFNKGITLGELENKNIIIKFLGQTIALEGGMYLFLGAISIYTKMYFLITIILIIIIEVTFFYIIRSNLNKFMNLKK
ncbi:hypothetical protein [Clostridium sp.]|uniref:hypothetical protein n=1 Tax=Clostridium sp. TaxID=1506 RepID=UPI00260FBD82|nr:hypothetical protein [Clostridium sp.]